MIEYRLSQRAAADLDGIAEYTIHRFGLKQARRYRDDLENCFLNLAKYPSMGQRVEQLARGLRRFEHGSHLIFYKTLGEGVLIVRVLHYRMAVYRHI